MKKTEAEIRDIISRVSFRDRTFRLLQKGDGWLLQLEYYEADVDKPLTQPLALQRSRKWYVSPWMTETEIVETAFAAVCRSMLHVAGEHFTYCGQRVYSPHISIDARYDMASTGWFDKREPKVRCWLCAETKFLHAGPCPAPARDP